MLVMTFPAGIKHEKETVADNTDQEQIKNGLGQGLSQDLETGCPKFAIVKVLGIQIFKGDHNILRFQP